MKKPPVFEIPAQLTEATHSSPHSPGRQHPVERSDEQRHSVGRPGTYETRDFYLACYLRALDFEMLNVRREATHSVFVFRDQQPERRNAIIAYYDEDGEVPALPFVSIIKEMKARLHNV